MSQDTTTANEIPAAALADAYAVILKIAERQRQEGILPTGLTTRVTMDAQPKSNPANVDSTGRV